MVNFLRFLMVADTRRLDSVPVDTVATASYFQTALWRGPGERTPDSLPPRGKVAAAAAG